MRGYRKKTLRTQIKEIISDFSNHIYGLITIIGLAITIVFAVLTLKNPSLEIESIFLVLMFCNFLFSIIIFSFAVKYSKLQTQYATLNNYQIENSNLKVLLQLQADTFHNINHYYRTLIHILDELTIRINSNETISQEEIDYVCERNNHFLVMLTASLQNYFSIHTDDNCSVALKILNPNTNEIKTLFRDPVNLKKRRQAEIENGLEIYSSNDNTAFSTILDKNKKEILFYSNDLNYLHEQHAYQNKNSTWFNYYTATIVTPISKNDRTQKNRHIVGFLTLDNKNGNLVDNTTIEIMWAVSDLLYNYIIKFSFISDYTIKNKLKNERATDYIFGKVC